MIDCKESQQQTMPLIAADPHYYRNDVLAKIIPRIINPTGYARLVCMRHEVEMSIHGYPVLHYIQ